MGISGPQNYTKKRGPFKVAEGGGGYGYTIFDKELWSEPTEDKYPALGPYANNGGPSVLRARVVFDKHPHWMIFTYSGSDKRAYFSDKGAYFLAGFCDEHMICFNVIAKWNPTRSKKVCPGCNKRVPKAILTAYHSLTMND